MAYDWLDTAPRQLSDRGGYDWVQAPDGKWYELPARRVAAPEPVAAPAPAPVEQPGLNERVRTGAENAGRALIDASSVGGGVATGFAGAVGPSLQRFMGRSLIDVADAPVAKDFAKSVGAGAVDLARQYVEGQTAYGGGGPQDSMAEIAGQVADAPERLALAEQRGKPLKDTAERLRASRSPASQVAEQRGLGEPSALSLINMTGESLPGTAVGMGEGAVLNLGLRGVANLAGRTLIREAAIKGSAEAAKNLSRLDTAIAAVSFGAGEADVASGQSALSVRDQIDAKSHDDLMANDRYRQLYAAGQDLPEAERRAYARETLTSEAAGSAALRTGLISFITGAPSGVLLTRIAQRIPILQEIENTATMTRAGAALHGAVGEGAQEFVQSGGQQLSENTAMRDSGFKDVGVLDNVGEQALAGAVGGAILGGGTGAAGRHTSAESDVSRGTAPTDVPAAGAGFQPATQEEVIDLMHQAKAAGIGIDELKATIAGINGGSLSLDDARDQLRSKLGLSPIDRAGGEPPGPPGGGGPRLLTGPEPAPGEPDFVVGRDAVAQTPEQAATPRLPAPEPRTDFEVGQEGVARRPGAGAYRALPAPEPTDTLAVDSQGVARPQTAGERGLADIQAQYIEQRNKERADLGLPPLQVKQAKVDATPADNTPSGKLQARVTKDPQKVASEYAKLDGTDGGRILSADLFKQLSPEYNADRTISDDLQSVASKAIDAEFRRKLTEKPAKGQQPLVVFTSGGTGAGKSTGLGKVAKKAQFVFDSNMSNYDSARARIDAALAAGKRVDVVHVYREPGEAYQNGVIPRATDPGKEGRPVTPDNHARMHANSNATVRKLAEHYADNPLVSIGVMDNSRGKKKARAIPIEQLPAVDYNAAREASQSALDAGYRAGTIPERIYRASGGKLQAPGQEPAPSASGAATERVRGHAEQERGPVDQRAADLEEAKGFVGRHQAGGGAVINPNDVYDAGTYAASQRLAEQQGRMPHIGHREWFDRPTKGLNAERSLAALDKAKEGKNLSPLEQEWVDYALKVVADAREQGQASLAADRENAEAAKERALQEARDAIIMGAPSIDELNELDRELDRLQREAEDEIDRIAAGEEAATEPVETAAARTPEGSQAPAESVEPAPRGTGGAVAGDLFGQDTSRAQGLADEKRKRDAARNSGQDSLETGDPTDMFSQARNQTDLMDAPAKKDVAKQESAPKGFYFVQAVTADGKKIFVGETLSDVIGEFSAWRDAEGLGSRDLSAINLFHDTKRTAANWKKIGTVAYNGNVTITDPDFNVAGAEQKALPAPEPAKAKTKSGKDIADFGEKIAGARKDYADKLAEAMDVDIAKVPLSESWPEPDYDKLLKQGADPWGVAFMHSARDEVPTKPSSSWKVKRWVENVKTLREFTLEVSSGDGTKLARVKQEFGKVPHFKDLASRMDLYMEVGHSKSLKGIALKSGSYSVFEGKSYAPSKVMWTIEQKAKKTAFSHWPRMIATAETREAVIAAFKEKWMAETPEEAKKKAVSFALYSQNGKYFAGRKLGKTYVRLKEFDDVKTAREYMANNQDELIALWDQARKTPFERRAENSPRVGIDHRSGADVTPEKFTEAFGFRGVQFGNYVEGTRRQADLNEAYDALMDLAGILEVPSQAMSLNGELGLAFGARGKGGLNPAAAHYEPVQVVINLTKMNGAGALAHEWFHALDNYFSRAGGSKAGFVTRDMHAGPDVRPEMLMAFREVTQQLRKSEMYKRAQKLDRTRSAPYWSTQHEMAARAFESYVIAKLQDQSLSNDYLSNIVSQQYWDAATSLGLEKADTYPYPKQAEMPAVREVFQSLFDTVEYEPTDKGVKLYSRGTPDNPPFYSALLRAVESSKLDKGTAVQWAGTLNNTPGVKAEEMDWTGLRDWLTEQKGLVTREQVSEFVRANQIQVEEVVKGAGGTAGDTARATADRLNVELTALGWDFERDMVGSGGALVRKSDGEAFIYVDDQWVNATTEEPIKSSVIPKRAKEIVFDLAEALQSIEESLSTADETRYGNYVLPAGENYRELLLTLPGNPSKAAGLTVDQMAKLLGYGGWSSSLTAEQQAKVNEAWAAQPYGPGAGPVVGAASDQYSSSHWQEPNILAHVRLTERADADGKRVLFVEEIQSDWHQTGRKRGYKTEEGVAALAAAEKAVAAARIPVMQEIEKEGNNFGFDSPGLAMQAFAKHDDFAERWDMPSDAAEVIGKWRDALSEARKAGLFKKEGVPDAPFKTTWPMLAFKRVLRWAAENGFDRIAWTTGDQQADRYDLSKHIMAIGYAKRGEETYRVAAWKEHASRPGQLGAEVVRNDSMDMKTIEETFGKEIAQKIANGEGNKEDGYTYLEGLDLKVGGEGMRGFYDDMLPKEVSKLIKKWGGKVGTTSISMPDPKRSDKIMSFDAPSEQPSVDITPAMRQAAMEGLPLFRARSADGTYTEGRPTVAKVKDWLSKAIEEVKGAVDVQIHENVDALRVALNDPDIPDNVEGVYITGGDTIHLVADQLPDRETAIRKFVHETFGHLAMERYADMRQAIEMTQRLLAAKSSPLVNGIAAEVDKLQPNLSRRDRAKEVIAMMAERGVRNSIIDKMIAGVRELLRRMGVRLQYTETELRALIAKAARALRTAAATGKGADDFVGDDRQFSEMPGAALYSIASKTSGRAYDWASKYFSWYGAFKNLPDQDVYRIERMLTQGTIERGEKLVRAVYDTFSKATLPVQQATYHYLTNAGAQPQSITDPAVRAKAVEVKELFNEMGREYVRRGMLSQETIDANKDSYLPRMYLKHLLGEKSITGLGTGKRVSDLGNLKERKDIDRITREIVLGEIKDPAFLAAAGLSRTIRDMALLDLLETVSKKSGWVLPQTLATWNGRKVSALWLKQEAERLRVQSTYMQPTPAAAAIKMAEDMEFAASVQSIAKGDSIRNYREVPDSPRYGMLRGVMVRKEIYDDLIGAFSIMPDSPDTAQRLIAGLTTASRVFKWMKVVASPQAQVRNGISNTIMLNISGVPMWRVPAYYSRAINELNKGGTYATIAEKYGLMSATFSAQELARINTEWTDLQKRLAAQQQHSTSKYAAETAMQIVKELGKKLEDLYGAVESIGKLTKLMHAIEVEGLSESQAALEANKWLFDYSAVPSSVRRLRNLPLGAPFLSYTYFVLPRLAEAAAKHPLRILPWLMLPTVLTAMTAALFHVERDDIERLENAQPGWMLEAGSNVILPWKDAEGRWQAMDLQYTMPWGGWRAAAMKTGKGEPLAALTGLSFGGGPVSGLLDVAHNYDSFRKKEIYDQGVPGVESGDSIATRLGKSALYLANTMNTPLLTPSGPIAQLWDAAHPTDTGSKMPDASIRTPWQSIASAAGMKISPYIPESIRAQTIGQMKRGESEYLSRMRREMAKPKYDAADRADMLRTAQAEIKRRRQLMMDYAEGSEIAPELATKQVASQ